MTKSTLVKIGVPPQLAGNMRQLRHLRQILDQGDAAVARIQASTAERMRAALAADAAGDESVTTEESVPAEDVQAQAH